MVMILLTVVVGTTIWVTQEVVGFAVTTTVLTNGAASETASTAAILNKVFVNFIVNELCKVAYLVKRMEKGRTRTKVKR